jgi:hypothetical protein
MRGTIRANALQFRGKECGASSRGSSFSSRFRRPRGPACGRGFQVNTYTTSGQNESSVASDASGNFVVVWAGYGQDGDYFGVFGQRFSAAGVALGAEFRVNSYTTSSQFTPAVASDPSGSFVLVWTSYIQDGSSWGVFGQRFNAAGAAQGAEFRVNTYTTGSQTRPSVATDESGNFVVVWTSYNQDSDEGDIFARRFDASGNPQAA